MIQEPAPTGKAAAEKPQERPRATTVRFVAVFVVLAFVQLAGYQLCLGTAASDWYLYQVARHTAWTLDVVGHNATLESAAPTNNPAATASPATPWERWRYRARQHREAGIPEADIGPRVSFVLRPSIHMRIQALEERRTAAEAADAPPQQVRELSAAIQALYEERNAGLSDPVRRRGQQGYNFTPSIIPSCGAIEVFAIYLAAVLAFPATWRARLLGAAGGLALLYLINVLRLACLAVIAAIDRGGPWYTFIHEYVWQAVYVVIVVVIWLAWVGLATRGRQS